MNVFHTLRDEFRGQVGHTIHVPSTLSAPLGPQGHARIVLRPMVSGDEHAWNSLRWRNREWLAPWESGDPMHGGGVTFVQWIRLQREHEKLGSGVIFLIVSGGTLAGQISLGAINYGAMRTGIVGYWVDRDHAGQGIAPTAVALLADWALHDQHGPRLHRLEIAILPENDRSRRVVEKLQARHEGIRPRYMYINGQWRDHDTFSLLEEDAPEGFVTRLGHRHTSAE